MIPKIGHTNGGRGDPPTVPGTSIWPIRLAPDLYKGHGGSLGNTSHQGHVCNCLSRRSAPFCTPIRENNKEPEVHQKLSGESRLAVSFLFCFLPQEKVQNLGLYENATEQSAN